MTNTHTYFSWLTLLMLLCGWLSHWLLAVRKAKKASIDLGTPVPSLFSYWVADLESTAMSVIGVVVFYFGLPSLANRFPELAGLIGSTSEDPLNPIAAYLGGFVAPSLADWAGRRLSKMVGD